MTLSIIYLRLLYERTLTVVTAVLSVDHCYLSADFSSMSTDVDDVLVHMTRPVTLITVSTEYHMIYGHDLDNAHCVYMCVCIRMSLIFQPT